MKIALVNTITPFVRGGAEILADDLRDQLIERGHQVVLFRLPFPDDYEVLLLGSVLAGKLLDFSSYDKVIAFKFPAYCVCHRHKTLWLFHQFRQVYDLYDILKLQKDWAMRPVVYEIDANDIGGTKNVFVIGDEVQKRLKRYNGLAYSLLYPPLSSLEGYYCGTFSDYVYYPSRVDEVKRQHLAIEAMRYVKTNARLILTGECKDPDYERRLRTTIQKYGLEDKVVYENIWTEEQEKLKLLSESMGVLFIPYQEDYGYVTLEAFYASKPMITCTDSGTPADFLQDGKNGYLAEPTPESIAEKIDMLYSNREKSEQMGRYAFEDIHNKDITWDKTIRSLLS